MKSLSFFFLICVMFICVNSKAQTTPMCYSTGNQSVSNVSSQICQKFIVRIYIHRMKKTSGEGYDLSVNDIVMEKLNSAFNKYGISFVLVGSRDWVSDSYTGAPFQGALGSLPTDSQNGKQNNAINIYLFKSINSSDAFGHVPDGHKNVIFLVGTRTVYPCNGSVNMYEVPISKIVAHEMGHSLGLVHTWENNGDDGLSDTPIDNNVQNNNCINPNNCIFSGGCSNCPLSSNPTTSMTNFMSSTVPPCMNEFTDEQVNLMRYNLKNSMSYVVSTTSTTGPNLATMTMETNAPLYSYNTVSVGYHYLFTYLNYNPLNPSVNWVKTGGTSNSWGIYGNNNANAWFSLSSGQYITLQVSAQDQCGTSYRTLTFAAQSAYKIASSPSFSNTLSIEFDNTTFSEALPQTVGIYNANNGKEDKVVNVKELFDSGFFKGNNKLDIDVKKIEKGKKILRFIYAKGSENGQTIGQEVKTENIFITD